MNRSDYMLSIRSGATNSRHLLIKAVNALSVLEKAITIVGAHAVHVWVQNVWGPVEMEATRDADIVLNPSFVADSPKIIELLQEIGIEPASRDRPGIYGLSTERALPWAARTTFDVLVPETYAGSGRRAARIVGQKNAASRAVGLELSLWDRHLMELAMIDDPKKSIEVFVAGPAALLVSKAHKVHERFEQVSIRPERLRPKDSGDVALLMMVSDPKEVAAVMLRSIEAHPEIREVVTAAARWLQELYGKSGTTIITRQQAADSLAARFDESSVFQSIDVWLDGFAAEV
jgi:hypothetical protein